MELDLIRVWHSRLSFCLVHFDKLSHVIFFLLYGSQITVMLFKSFQINNLFKSISNSGFTIECYVCFVSFAIYCYFPIHFIRLPYDLNYLILKPGHYIHEIGMHPFIDEPSSFADYYSVSCC